MTNPYVAKNKNLSRNAIRHEHLQVKRMIKDRPLMGKHITKKDFVWKWAVRKFAGEDLPDTIDWNNGNPYQGAWADCVHPAKSEGGYIRIKNLKNDTFDSLWAKAVFELINITLYVNILKLIQKAYRGQISKKNFIINMAKIEFKAVKMTEQFYKEIWEPWSQQRNFSTVPHMWYVGIPIRFEDWLKGYDKKSDYPWKVYSHFYDNHLKEWVLA